jgi:hypothetical protein
MESELSECRTKLLDMAKQVFDEKLENSRLQDELESKMQAVHLTDSAENRRGPIKEHRPVNRRIHGRNRSPDNQTKRYRT